MSHDDFVPDRIRAVVPLESVEDPEVAFTEADLSREGQPTVESQRERNAVRVSGCSQPARSPPATRSGSCLRHTLTSSPDR